MANRCLHVAGRAGFLGANAIAGRTAVRDAVIAQARVSTIDDTLRW